MALVPHVPRRPLTIVLVVVAVIAIGLVAAALWNPWRLTPLYPLARQGGAVGVLVLGGALLATAGLLRFSAAGRSAVIGLAISLVAVPALCVGLPVVAFDGAFRRESGSEVMAVSPDGGFVAVKSTFNTHDDERTRIFIQSQHGLLSREAADPIAECSFDPFKKGVPPESVRFTSETTVALPIGEDLPTTVVRFDPDSLRPEQTVLMCPG